MVPRSVTVSVVFILTELQIFCFSAIPTPTKTRESFNSLHLSPHARALDMAKSKAPATPAKNGTPDKNGENPPIRNLYLVDGSGYLFRAYHALPPMTRPDGTPINAVYGFCRMLVADLLDKPEVDHVAMILDSSEVTFRNKIYDKYKANRPPPPDDLIPQFPLIREAAKAFNVTVCESDGYEADDL